MTKKVEVTFITDAEYSDEGKRVTAPKGATRAVEVEEVIKLIKAGAVPPIGASSQGQRTQAPASEQVAETTSVRRTGRKV